MVLILLLEPYPLNVLLILNFLLDVLVSLEQFVVLGLSQLESLVQVCLELLLKRVHLVLLSLNELGFGGNDLLVSLLHVFLTFLSLELLAPDLNLVSFLIS